MKNKYLLISLLGLALVACGQRGGRQAAPAPATRDFPMAEIPSTVVEPEERAGWLAEHFWDKFTNPAQLYACDSTLVNGVPQENLERQMGIFAALLRQMPLEKGVPAMRTLYHRLAAFQQAHPGSNVFPELVELTSRYFYDPNSPLRNEDLYQPFVEALSRSELVPEDSRPGYAWTARMCSLNAVGTPATDFTFIDTKGRRRTLYGIQADITLLIFGNPDCQACRELVATMDEYPELMERIQKGHLCVVDVYVDEEIDVWKQRMADYPQAWINGYDPDFKIRTDLLYHVRAVPSLYLLDQDKTVLMKDAAPEDVLEVLL